MLAICNGINKKFCIGSACEHRNPHELNTLETFCNDECFGNDNEYHEVKCVKYYQKKEK